MDLTKTWRIFSFLVAAIATGTIFGCAHYEVNTGRGGIPGYYIRSEMQDSDRAVEAARQAGKDKLCPADYKAAEDAKNHAYDVYRACHTEEGVALAQQATAMANALCPPVSGMKEEEAPLVAVPAAEPAPGRMKYCISLNIEYDIDKADIRPQYHDEVARVGDFMKKYPETTAVIEGNTDEVGSDEHNMRLSLLRAESVVNYLVKEFGIDRSRLTAKGYGKTRPIADNATDAGKQKNRRIDAIIDCAFDVKYLAPPPERLCMALKVEFDTDSAEIKPIYNDEIDKVGEYMKKYPTTTAVIEGHTDNVGAYDHNMQLSQQRAESVVNYLTNKFGIESSRLSAKGYGPTRRIAYNTTPEGRQKNRRIDAVIDCVIVK
ncbi:MAG: OmpA family protein [Oryzomonas sp.]|uniref:OmpA family protein n=1 Tax=Oryzomonas sp. TaxID=2855186 RepID=UPI00284F9805|nr:OmpA family protein [Oryzomonas sp.]MDR3579954.1 OmpA family protein [Oryzomonas sp.]